MHTPFHKIENIQSQTSFLSPYLEESQRQVTQERQVVGWLKGGVVIHSLQPPGEDPRNHVLSYDIVQATALNSQA